MLEAGSWNLELGPRISLHSGEQLIPHQVFLSGARPATWELIVQDCACVDFGETQEFPAVFPTFGMKAATSNLKSEEPERALLNTVVVWLEHSNMSTVG